MTEKLPATNSVSDRAVRSTATRHVDDGSNRANNCTHRSTRSPSTSLIPFANRVGFNRRATSTFQPRARSIASRLSDDRRPEEVELENRSTGLQWFLSFYLVFLVESQGDHEDAVLLLDEPGLSLHPLAQRDLSAFFDGLTQTNQIIYTTHSPFLVDPDRLDRVRKVFVAEDGSTECSPNLRQSGADPAQAGAAYAVYSALNLNVAESLLLGCLPVVVEGASDQHYLTMIKALLIGAGKITPRRELVFPPAGGTKTLRITASILTGRDETLPVVLLDGDQMGTRMAAELISGLYKGEEKKVLSTDEFTTFNRCKAARKRLDVRNRSTTAAKRDD